MSTTVTLASMNARLQLRKRPAPRPREDQVHFMRDLAATLGLKRWSPVDIEPGIFILWDGCTWSESNLKFEGGYPVALVTFTVRGTVITQKQLYRTGELPTPHGEFTWNVELVAAFIRSYYGDVTTT